MKPFALLTFLSIFLAMASCSKKDETVAPGELPTWVKQKVEELTANGESCKVVYVMLYDIDGKKYYNIDFGYSSCAMCNIFDEKGRPVSQTEKAGWNDIKVVDWFPGCK